MWLRATAKITRVALVTDPDPDPVLTISLAVRAILPDQGGMAAEALHGKQGTAIQDRERTRPAPNAQRRALSRPEDGPIKLKSKIVC